LRAWRRRIFWWVSDRRNALRVARAEIKDIKRMLERSGVPARDVSRASPVLLRCLFQRQRIMLRIVTIMSLTSVFIVLLPLVSALFYLEKLSYPLVTSVIGFYTGLFMLTLAAYAKLSPMDDFQRVIKYSTTFRRQSAKFFLYIYYL
jgi:hypothetical protein